ncbi:MAG: hypothetical protein KatS3mg057_0197 [Herpetosiphonaceae bacterium]|nr:MAG: hypothetical protein KatS3mg057_0197 [Herpetosiphonaceae bacterium]
MLAHEKFNRPLAFRWLGEFLERLQGRYHAGPDMGVTAEDLAYVRSATAYIAHGYGGPTDYGEWTALGVFHALTAAVEHRAGEPAPWPELRVVVQGLGQVGWSICRRLWEVGAQLVVTDIDAERVRRARETFGAGVVQPDEILFCDADVLVPCAAGQIIDPAAAAALRCWLVCGSANGILTHPDVALLLHERGILMVPDILSSAGAVIAGALRFFKQADDESIAGEVGKIATRTRHILAQASETGQPPLWVALDRVARRL